MKEMHHGNYGDCVLTSFYKGRKVLVTGHTGFKGSWLCRILSMMGADVYGYAMNPPTNPNLYSIIKSDGYIQSKIGDICDFNTLYDYYKAIKPDVVFHLAAQPLVIEGYNDPLGTYRTNVMGTVNILECVRKVGAISFLNVTTDKVYDNDDSEHTYSEGDRLDGFDPYSNSKSCSELVTHCYSRSFSKEMCPISTARAGNVIGGGDFSADRIVPDCVRAGMNNEVIRLRNPNSIRPYQHVLEPLFAYLQIAKKQAEDIRYAGNYNIGPDESDCVSTKIIAELFCKYWGEGLGWESISSNGPHESAYLKLDNSKLKDKLSISPLWDIEQAIKRTVEWTKVWRDDPSRIVECSERQIRDYFEERGELI